MIGLLEQCLRFCCQPACLLLQQLFFYLNLAICSSIPIYTNFPQSYSNLHSLKLFLTPISAFFHSLVQRLMHTHIRAHTHICTHIRTHQFLSGKFYRTMKAEKLILTFSIYEVFRFHQKLHIFFLLHVMNSFIRFNVLFIYMYMNKAGLIKRYISPCSCMCVYTMYICTVCVCVFCTPPFMHYIKFPI